MASAELVMQTNIVNSIRKDGGYARRLVDKYALGLLDLFVGLPPFVPTLIEAKHLGVVGGPFDRKIPLRAKQEVEINKLNDPYIVEALRTRVLGSPAKGGTVIFVGWTSKLGHHYLTAMPGIARRIDSEKLPLVVQRGIKGYYPNIRDLLDEAGLLTVRHR